MLKESPSCFVAIPDSETLAPIRQTVEQTLLAHNVRPLFGPDSSLRVLELIERSDMVIADVTYASPAVYYELGIAHALRKPTLILAQKQEVPFDLLGQRVLRYYPDEIDKLSSYLPYWIQDSLELRLAL